MDRSRALLPPGPVASDAEIGADEAPGVATTTNAVAEYSEAMDPATLKPTTVTLVKQGTTTPGSSDRSSLTVKICGDLLVEIGW